LSSVGEVVVSRAHVVECTGEVHSDESSIEVRSRSSVELHAVSLVLLNVVLVVSVLRCQLIVSEASSLSKLAHPHSEVSRLEERGVRGNPLVISRERRIEVRELNHVGSVCACSSFSSVSVGVSIASSPLEVDVISLSSGEECGDKIVLGGGVSLDDVSSLSSHVEVENSLKEGDGGGSWLDVEDVRSVLEGSSELSGIESHGHVISILGLGGILADG